MDYTSIASFVLSGIIKFTGIFLNFVMENPIVGLTMTGVSLLLIVFLSKKIASLAFSFTNIILIICIIVFILVSLTALGYNVSKFVGFLPQNFNINDWLLNITRSFIGK
jgi:hypothetical protein